jgi:hypothetical protein
VDREWGWGRRRRSVPGGAGREIQLEASPQTVVRGAEVRVEVDLVGAGDRRESVKRLLPAEPALLAVHALAERDTRSVRIEELGVEVGRPLGVEAPEPREEELALTVGNDRDPDRDA